MNPPEYMMRTNMGPLWGYEKCFGGVSKLNPLTIEVNQEPGHVINMLVNNFETKPKIQKVQFASPYDQIIDMDYPQKHPLVRIPTAGSTYLYDADCVTGNASDYVNSLDVIITNLTNSGVAVSFDLHWSCSSPTALNCNQTGNGPMALREYNGPGSMGTIDFWDAVSKRYANNPYVFYEVYNEPHLQHGEDNFDIYYSGNDVYVGMLELYQTIRKNDPNGLIILAGMQQYAYDSATLIAFWLRYYQQFGQYPTNIIFNYHPYQGGPQGTNKALQGVLRMIAAGKLLAPVIFTEFCQFCCAESYPTKCSNGRQMSCNGHPTSDNFSYNLVNFAVQYDISWTTWAWQGIDAYSALACNNGNCCVLRNDDGSYVSNGTYGGAPWALIWKEFVDNTEIKVKNTQTDDVTINVKVNVEEEMGYLPIPCIVGDYGMGNECGYSLGTNITMTNYSIFAGQSISYAILPGMPPFNNCTQQGCPTLPCGSSPVCKYHS